MAEPVLTPAFLDSVPQTEEKFNAKRDALLPFLMEQAREPGAAAGVQVTCPCGRKTMVFISGARCLYCGVIFCFRCAARHFNRPQEEPSRG